MKNTIDLSTFKKAFHDYGRGDNFSNEGLEALFNFLSEVEYEYDEDIKINIEELCCDFVEYDADDFVYEFMMYGDNNDTSFLIDECGLIENDNINIDELKKYLSRDNIFIPVSKTRFIIQQF